MERRLVGRGIVAGAIAGLLAFLFARIFAEPVINAAIRYESGRDAAQNALNQSLGLPADASGPDIFSRTVQANIGIGVGIVVFGAAMGALFALVYAVCLGRVGRLRPRVLAMLLAGAGFLGLYLVPFLKYPANPPAIGHAETIRERSLLYLGMVGASVVFLVLSVMLGKALAERFGNWNASLIAGSAYIVVMGLVMAMLPMLGHLPFNVAQYGRHATETPLPLTDNKGVIVYPGFPADTLVQFRLYSVAAQVLLWSAIGLTFGPMAERLLAPGSAAPRRSRRKEHVGQLA
jgi:hypothetical protein